MGGTGKGVGELVGPERGERAGRRVSVRRRSATGLRRFWRVMMDANVTGSSAMVAYNMLLGVVPVALLALFVGGQILLQHYRPDALEREPTRAHQLGLESMISTSSSVSRMHPSTRAPVLTGSRSM